MNTIFLRYKRLILFVIIYSISFFVFKSLFIYLLPFTIGIFVSLIMYPVYSFMKKRLSFKPAFSATVITLFIFLIIILLFSYMFFLLIKESISLYSKNQNFFDSIKENINFSNFIEVLNLSSDIFYRISDTAFSVVKIISVTFALIIVSFVCTVFTINNLPNIKCFVFSKFSNRYHKRLNDVIENFNVMFKKFVRSYCLLYVLTFAESFFIFFVIDIEYKLILAFLTAVSDVLPVLGPGTVFLPISLILLFSGDYLKSITLIIFWILVIIIRQIIEPKLLSDTIKINPLIILSALYFSIVSSNFWVFFYIIIFTVVYKILVESSVLNSVFDLENKES